MCVQKVRVRQFITLENRSATYFPEGYTSNSNAKSVVGCFLLILASVPILILLSGNTNSSQTDESNIELDRSQSPKIHSASENESCSIRSLLGDRPKSKLKDSVRISPKIDSFCVGQAMIKASSRLTRKILRLVLVWRVRLCSCQKTGLKQLSMSKNGLWARQ